MTLWRLYYDGSCNLCHRSRLRAEAWAVRAGQPLVVALIQSPEAQAKGYGDAMTLEADQLYVGVDAWLKLCEMAPWPARAFAWLGRLPGGRAMANLAYGVVARLRYKLFGRRACPLPR